MSDEELPKTPRRVDASQLVGALIGGAFVLVGVLAAELGSVYRAAWQQSTELRSAVFKRKLETYVGLLGEAKIALDEYDLGIANEVRIRKISRYREEILFMGTVPARAGAKSVFLRLEEYYLYLRDCADDAACQGCAKEEMRPKVKKAIKQFREAARKDLYDYQLYDSSGRPVK